MQYTGRRRSNGSNTLDGQSRAVFMALATMLTPRFLRFLLLASLATAIAAGIVLSRNYDNERQANIIRNLLKASYIVSLGESRNSLVTEQYTDSCSRHRHWHVAQGYQHDHEPRAQAQDCFALRLLHSPSHCQHLPCRESFYALNSWHLAEIPD